MLSSIRHLDYVVLMCDDVARMRDFYRDVMGFTVHLETENWIELRVGSVLLALSRRRAGADGEPSGSDAASGPAVQLAFRVAPQEVVGCYEELLANGVGIVQPPQTIDRRLWQYWQHRTLFFNDPEGNLLEIYAEIESSEDGASLP